MLARVLLVVVAFCAVFLGIWMAGVADAPSVEDLPRACALILDNGERFGMGFFLECEYEGCKDIWFVTAAHNLSNLGKQKGQEPAKLTLAAKSGQHTGAVKVVLACDDQAAIISASDDLALIRVDRAILLSAQAEIAPVKIRIPLERRGVPDGLSRSGFLLKADRTRLGMGVGSDVFAVTSLKCDERALLSELFPLLVRKGVLSLIHEASGTNTAEKSRMVVDVLSSPGNSGAPVFIPIRGLKALLRFYGTKPQFLGIVSTMVSAEGRPQTFDLPLYEGDRQTGRVRGTQMLKENTGLSLIIPADHIAGLLTGHYGGYGRSK